MPDCNAHSFGGADRRGPFTPFPLRLPRNRSAPFSARLACVGLIVAGIVGLKVFG
jgi:hypothetical protein